MDLRKLERSTALLREELTDILRSEVRDPRLNAVTVTSVRLSRDRRYARVYVDLAEKEQEDEQEVLAALRRAAGFVRRCLAQRLTWYKAPEIAFERDEGMKQGDRVLALFRDLELEDEPQEDPSAPESEEVGRTAEEVGNTAAEAGRTAEEVGSTAAEADTEHAEERSSQ